MSWQAALERTVSGLGYDLVDAGRSGRTSHANGAKASGGGLLRVTIDRRDGEPVTVDDCEAVTRQLQYVLEVEQCDYARLEVSSPGLDRPLKSAADYLRFAGQPVDLTLKQPFQGRKHWRGLLQPREGGWRLVLDAAAPAASKTKLKAAAKAGVPIEAAPEQALDFELDEVREARLVPVVDFKGRRFATAAPALEGGPEQ